MAALLQAANPEDLKDKLTDPANEGCCIKYTKEQRESYLARINDRILHVDKHGRATPPDIRALIESISRPNAPFKILDLTGQAQINEARSRGWNYGDLPPPEDPQALVTKAVEQIKAGTFVELSTQGASQRFGIFSGSKERTAPPVSEENVNLRQPKN
ncbi:MAG: hypothetical protein ACYCQI_01870 [Gammaproteobacteria bacterium]